MCEAMAYVRPHGGHSNSGGGAWQGGQGGGSGSGGDGSNGGCGGGGATQQPGVFNPAAAAASAASANGFNIPPGGEQMMQFAAGSLSQGVNSRLQSAVPLVGGYWTSLKAYFEVLALL